MHILLVEPDTQLAQTYSEILQMDGHNVINAKDAQMAVSQIDERAPDLIILEPQLAQHNGIEFLYEFRSYSEWQRIPVLILSFISPGTFSHYRYMLKQLGVEDYLYKPSVTLAHLRRYVARFALA